MAIYWLKNIGKQGKIGLWHITEPVEELLSIKPFPEYDLNTIHSFSNESRKKEWLVSRLLADKLTGSSNISIYYDEHNKPFLRGSAMHISISHSHALQAVNIDHKPTGVDIELIQPKITSIKNKFMSDEELTFIDEKNQLEKLTLCWGIKEALYKYYGKKELVFKEHLKIHPFIYSLTGGNVRAYISKGNVDEECSFVYETITIDASQYMLVYIVNHV